jgi:TatD DNase family protein
MVNSEFKDYLSNESISPNNLIGSFDSHCHLEQDLDGIENLISACEKIGMKGVTTVCARPQDLERTISIAKKFPFVYYAVGIHPLEAIKNKNMINQYASRIKNINENIPKPVAIGEIGLDYFLIEKKDINFSKEVFTLFIDLSKELKLPIIIHCRDAYGDVIEILKEKKAKEVVFHYFNSPEYAKEIIDQGWHLSLPYTISKSKIKSIFESTTLDNIMIETDSPIKLGDKWISPLNLGELVSKISSVTGIDEKRIVEKTTNTALSFYRIE